MPLRLLALASVVALWSCATAPVEPPPAAPTFCRPWIGRPGAFGRPALLLGVGSAPLSSPDPPAAAEQGALADMAAQVRVRVRATEVSDQRSETREGRERQTQRLAEQVDSSSDVTFEGAVPVDGCTANGWYFVLMGVSRASVTRRPLERLQQLAADLRSLDGRAAVAAAGGDHLSAAHLYQQAAPEAERAERLAQLVRALGAEAPGAVFPPATQDRSRAREALQMAGIAVAPSLAAPEDGPLLASAEACLARTGLPAAAPGKAEISLLLHLDPGQPARLYAGLFMTQVQLAATLQRHSDGAILSASGAVAKGVGATPRAAVQDAVRRLAAERLGRTLDRLLAALDEPLRRCGAAADPP